MIRIVLALFCSVMLTSAALAADPAGLVERRQAVKLLEMDFLLQKEKASHAKDRMELLKYQRRDLLAEIKRLEAEEQAERDKAKEQEKAAGGEPVGGP